MSTQRCRCQRHCCRRPVHAHLQEHVEESRSILRQSKVDSFYRVVEIWSVRPRWTNPLRHREPRRKLCRWDILRARSCQAAGDSCTAGSLLKNPLLCRRQSFSIPTLTGRHSGLCIASQTTMSLVADASREGTCTALRTYPSVVFETTGSSHRAINARGQTSC